MSETPAERAARVERMHEKCARRGGGSMADVTTLRNDVRAMYAEYDRVRAELDARLAAESADAAAGSYAGRAEEAEARAQYLDEEALRLQRTVGEARKQRDDWQQAFGAAYARAEQAEAALAEMRELKSVLVMLLMRSGGTVEFSTAERVQTSMRGEFVSTVDRVTGVMRLKFTPQENATPRTALERAADEQGVREGGGDE